MACVYSALRWALFADSCAVADSTAGSCKQLDCQPGLTVDNFGTVPLPLSAAVSKALADCTASSAADDAGCATVVPAGSFDFRNAAWHAGCDAVLAAALRSLGIDSVRPLATNVWEATARSQSSTGQACLCSPAH